jgi:hypothetical protein
MKALWKAGSAGRRSVLFGVFVTSIVAGCAGQSATQVPASGVKEQAAQVALDRLNEIQETIRTEAIGATPEQMKEWDEEWLSAVRAYCAIVPADPDWCDGPAGELGG